MNLNMDNMGPVKGWDTKPLKEPSRPLNGPGTSDGPALEGTMNPRRAGTL